MTDRPSIILIITDQQRYDTIGALGYPHVDTPNLDRLAAEGTRFEHCYSQPLCTPTRVQLMTGQYNFRNYEDFGYLRPQDATFAQLLQQAGYATAVAGKWQLNGLSHKKPRHDDPRRANEAGFDEYCLWQLTQPRSPDAERFEKPWIEQNGRKLDTSDQDYGPDIFAGFIQDFITRKRDQPWLVYYPMVLTHDPFVPTPASAGWGTKQKSHPRHFKDMIEYMDAIVGRLVDHLESLGLRENTIILFTGDNGTHPSITTQTRTGSVQGGKGNTTDAGTRVPFIVSWTRLSPAGVVSRDLVDFTDFFPTLLEAAGLKAPADLMLDGRSFLPQLKGEMGRPREWVFCHYHPRWGNRDQWKGRFARDHRFKLYDDGRLYDVPADPLEESALDTANLPPGAMAARTRLQAVLDSMPPWTEDRPH
ncbi:MAG TPA: arylsulfatase A [Verrucomicrobiales bacterium]|nr:arylsulfatase A [Verrucomicrobiales bacterium]